MYTLHLDYIKEKVPRKVIQGIPKEGEEGVVGLLNIEAFYLLNDFKRGLMETFGALPTIGLLATNFVRRDEESIINLFSGIYANMILFKDLRKEEVIDVIRSVVRYHNTIKEELAENISKAYLIEVEDYNSVGKQMIALTNIVEKFMYKEAMEFIDIVNDPMEYEMYVTSRVVTLIRVVDTINDMMKKHLQNESELVDDLSKALAKLTEIGTKVALHHYNKRNKLFNDMMKKVEVIRSDAQHYIL